VARRRARGLFPPGRLSAFCEADWPPPAEGPDPAAEGLACGNTEEWLTLVALEHGEGLAAAHRTSFAWARWVQARLDYLGKDHPRYWEVWIDGTAAEHRFVHEYVAQHPLAPR
jgi:hypothetical protein